MAASQVLLLLVRRASLRFPKIIHRLPLPFLTSSFHRPSRNFSAISSSSNAHQQQTSTAEDIDLNEEIAKLEKQRENVARLVTTRAREQEELSLDLQQQTPLAAASECTNVTDLEIETGSETEVEGPESAVATGGVHMNHPWDEWNAFLDVLHQKDYFKDVPQSALEGEGSSSFMVSTWMKHAISEFGHDRDDIIRSLSKRHIRMMVNVGCPSLDRKVVNASKRLRVYCETPEDEVCQQCKLKAFCTRAFAEPAPKIDAGTCDVVRVLYSYALNASPYAESQVAFPVGVTKSACQLLREVVNLSAYPKKPDVRKNRSVDQSRGVKKTFDRQYSESRPGDWSCPNCEFLNFSRNQECKDCGTVRESAQQPLEPGDWECPGCTFRNFKRNRVCRSCSTPHPVNNNGARGKDSARWGLKKPLTESEGHDAAGGVSSHLKSQQLKANLETHASDDDLEEDIDFRDEKNKSFLKSSPKSPRNFKRRSRTSHASSNEESSDSDFDFIDGDGPSGQIVVKNALKERTTVDDDQNGCTSNSEYVLSGHGEAASRSVSQHQPIKDRDLSSGRWDTDTTESETDSTQDEESYAGPNQQRWRGRGRGNRGTRGRERYERGYVSEGGLADGEEFRRKKVRGGLNKRGTGRSRRGGIGTKSEGRGGYTRATFTSGDEMGSNRERHKRWNDGGKDRGRGRTRGGKSNEDRGRGRTRGGKSNENRRGGRARGVKSNEDRSTRSSSDKITRSSGRENVRDGGPRKQRGTGS